MKVTVIGFGHFACTVATGLALRGHDVKQFDLEPHLIREGQSIDKEPNWPAVQIESVDAIPSDSQIVWVAYDTPLDANGRGDTSLVEARVAHVCRMLVGGQVVLLSPQWPVGTASRIIKQYPALRFAYVVENIRVGSALPDFINGSPFIVGVPRGSSDYETCWPIYRLLHHIKWMGVESAEMSKHALNAFLALQIAFANEIDALCHLHGASGDDVHRALIADKRVSERAPLKPGEPFGGGSLQRDVLTLNELAVAGDLGLPLISSIITSNELRRGRKW